MAAPILNPPVPCVYPIPGGMFPGRVIRFQGNSTTDARRFAINLQCGPSTDPSDDIALHMDFRFSQSVVVRNSLTNRKWGKEERGGGMPMASGDTFEITIHCEQNSFRAAINGGNFCDYLHRIPFQRVSYLSVNGDVMLDTISIEGTQAGRQQQQQQQMAPGPAYAAPGYVVPQPVGKMTAAYVDVRVQQFYNVAMYPPQGGMMPMQMPMQQMPMQQMPMHQMPMQQMAPAPMPVMTRQQLRMQQRQQMRGGRRGGMGTGAGLALGATGLAAGALGGYALGGGFDSDGAMGFPDTGTGADPTGEDVEVDMGSDADDEPEEDVPEAESAPDIPEAESAPDMGDDGGDDMDDGGYDMDDGGYDDD